VAAGWLEARGELLAVMDADLQHPPDVIGKVIATLQGGADIVVASRYIEGGQIPNWKLHRRLLSLLGTGAVRVALGSKMRGITDPLSGCFGFRRSALDPQALRPNAGFKILLEVLSCGDFRNPREVPYEFATRTGGESKLTMSVAIRDFALLARLIFDRNRQR